MVSDYGSTASFSKVVMYFWSLVLESRRTNVNLNKVVWSLL